MIEVYEQFFPTGVADEMFEYVASLGEWSHFQRNESHMEEFYDVDFIVRARFTSKSMVEWVQKETGINGLVIDPIGVGEGVSKMTVDDKINTHVDFNWNDRCKLNREVTMMYYLGICEGGELVIADKTIAPMHNTLVMFTQKENYPHEVKTVTKGFRFNIRTFYYSSNSKPIEKPHQSLYWHDGNTFYNPSPNMPTNSNDKD